MSSYSEKTENEVDRAVNRLFKDAAVRQQRQLFIESEFKRQQQEQVNNKPTINAKSKEMTSKGPLEPIHKRFGKMLERKERRL